MDSLSSRNHSKYCLQPRLDHDLPTLFAWLQGNGLTYNGARFDRSSNNSSLGPQELDNSLTFAQATGRHSSQPLTSEELKKLKETFKDVSPGVSQEALWGAVLNASSSIRSLLWNKLPAEAMAFYRPFHLPPVDQWGIYLLIEPLLNYHNELMRLSQALKLFSAETLMHLIVFEIFNHEFFHHLVESTATTLELILATQGEPQPVYLRHWHQQANNHFEHPHAPLEEALANAYAYNALGFISRLKIGCKTASVKAYQKAIIEHWHFEPAGYRDAGHYKGGGYIDGGTQLLAQLLNQPTIAEKVPLSIIAKHVMPTGFSALVAKPYIPTWLVGSPEQLEIFYQLVPAPNEAYTQLFWPYNTNAIDTYIAEKKEEEKARKAALKTTQAKGKQQTDLWDE